MEGCLGIWISVLITVTLFTGSNSQGVPPFNWTMGNVSRMTCGPAAFTKCFFVTPDIRCLQLPESKIKTDECPIIISVEPPEEGAVDPLFTFKLIGPYVRGRSALARWVGVGLKRLDSVTASAARMDNALIIACVRGRSLGRDVLSITMRYTQGNGIFPIFHVPEKQLNETILDGKLRIFEGRLMCEFKTKAEFPIIRPPVTGVVLSLDFLTATFKLKTETYNILAAYGNYDHSKRATEAILYHNTQRMLWETQSLIPTDCGRIKSCLGKGKDGCGHVTNDCPIVLRIEPRCNESRCNETRDANSYIVEMESESKTSVAVMVGFADRTPGIGTFRLVEMGLMLSCEKPTDGSPRVVVPRMNTCYGPNKTLTPTELKACRAVKLGESPTDTGEIVIRNVTFDTGTEMKWANQSWLTCSFIFDYIVGKTFVTLPEKNRVNVTQTLDFIASKFFLAVGVLEQKDLGPDVTGGYSTESLPIPTTLIFTRLEAFLWDIQRVDIQLIPGEIKIDTRIPLAINEKDPNSAHQMASNSIFILLVSALALILALA